MEDNSTDIPQPSASHTNYDAPFSTPCGKIAKALAQAQGEFPGIPKNKVARVGTYSYKYADLPDIISAVAPVLAGVEISRSDYIDVDGAKVTCTCYLIHSSGEWLSSKATMTASAKGGQDITPQAIGSATTYARRYALCSVLGIAADEDEDGNLASNTSAETQRVVREAQQRSAPPNRKEKQKTMVMVAGVESGYDSPYEALIYLHKCASNAPMDMRQDIVDANKDLLESSLRSDDERCVAGADKIYKLAQGDE